MFNLKDKLLKQGLVTKEMVERASKAEKDLKNQRTMLANRAKALNSLKNQNKNEQYATIRKWVELNRLDKSSEASLDDEKFFFEAQGQLTSLTLKKDVIQKLKDGSAGIIAYISNHGLVHAVVSREIAQDIAHIFPEWLRVLHESPASSSGAN